MSPSNRDKIDAIDNLLQSMGWQDENANPISMGRTGLVEFPQQEGRFTWRATVCGEVRTSGNASFATPAEAKVAARVALQAWKGDLGPEVRVSPPHRSPF